MSNPRLPFKDGDFTKPVQVKPPIVWNDPVTGGLLTTYTFNQAYTNYITASAIAGTVAGGIRRGAKDRNGYILVEWSEPREAGGGNIEFTRTFAAVPPKRTRFESFNYTYQFNTQASQIIEQPLLVKSRVDYEYYFSLTPAKIVTRRALKLFMFGSQLRFVGDPVNPNDAERLAEDEMLSDWKGGVIWEKKSRYVPNRVSNRFE